MDMRRVRKLAATALGVAAVATALPASARHRQVPPARPVVVELFTAQGCSACPQADALLQELAGRKNVLALTFPVDVWDYLGWADTLAKPEFAARQKAYVARFKLRELYTPEMVVDGRRETLGFDREKVQALVDAAARARPAGPRVRFSPGATRATVGEGAAQPGAGPRSGWSATIRPSARSRSRPARTRARPWSSRMWRARSCGWEAGAAAPAATAYPAPRRRACSLWSSCRATAAARCWPRRRVDRTRLHPLTGEAWPGWKEEGVGRPGTHRPRGLGGLFRVQGPQASEPTDEAGCRSHVRRVHVRIETIS